MSVAPSVSSELKDNRITVGRITTMVTQQCPGIFTEWQSSDGDPSMPAEMQVEGPMKVLLVGNYEFDGSTSMKIWANSLLRELLQRGIDVELISPKPVFGRMRRSADGLGKWLGYLDRFVIFPREFARRGGQSECGSSLRSWHRRVRLR